jgi:hypothetical protein
MRGAPSKYIQQCQDVSAVIDDDEIPTTRCLRSSDPEESEDESAVF